MSCTNVVESGVKIFTKELKYLKLEKPEDKQDLNYEKIIDCIIEFENLEDSVEKVDIVTTIEDEDNYVNVYYEIKRK